MTTIGTDDRKDFEAWAQSRGMWMLPSCNGVGTYCGSETEGAWESWQAALRSQGKVVSIEKLKALQPYWCDWNDQALDEETDPEGSLKSFPTISIVYKYEDLTAIIGEGD
jgi:hypothetical protein